MYEFFLKLRRQRVDHLLCLACFCAVLLIFAGPGHNIHPQFEGAVVFEEKPERVLEDLKF